MAHGRRDLAGEAVAGEVERGEADQAADLDGDRPGYGVVLQKAAAGKKMVTMMMIRALNQSHHCTDGKLRGP